MSTSHTGNIQPKLDLEEHQGNLNAKRVVPLNAEGNPVDTPLASRIDEASATVTYIGKATPGTATSASLWQVQKIDTTTGTVITWADGNALFDNIWDSRSSLSYS